MFSTDSDYAANIEKAEAVAPAGDRSSPSEEMAEVATPEQRTIEAVATFLNVDASRCAKTLLVKARHSDLLERWKAQHYLHDTDEVDDAIDTDSDDDGTTDTDANPLDAGLMLKTPSPVPAPAPEPIKKKRRAKPKAAKPIEATSSKSSLAAAINTTVTFDL